MSDAKPERAVKIEYLLQGSMCKDKETPWEYSRVREAEKEEVAGGDSFVRPFIDINATGELRLHVIVCKKTILLRPVMDNAG